MSDERNEMVMGMTDLRELREDLEQLRAYVADGNRDEALRRIDQTLQGLDGERRVTTTEAAELLGIQSVEIVRLLCNRGDIQYTVGDDGEAMISLSEIERVRDSEPVRMIRTLDRLHDEIEELGFPGEPLTEEEMEMLQASRPGTLPWER